MSLPTNFFIGRGVGGVGGEPFQGFSLSTSTTGRNYSASEMNSNIAAITTNSQLARNGGKYEFYITQNGSYSITARGSKGATDSNTLTYGEYGRGGEVIGTFSLLQDDKITVVLGQEGTMNGAGTDTNGGGGGATYVIINDDVSDVYAPLMIAGGGMGGHSQSRGHTNFSLIADGGWTSSTYYRSNDVNWSNLSNSPSTVSYWNEAHVWYMGTSSNNSQFDENILYGGGGCGGTLLDDGADRIDSAGARGRSYISGALGGEHPTASNATGGYGSGGASRDWSSAGGGGGWIGGASRNYPPNYNHLTSNGYTNLKHGGASYINASATNVSTTQGANNAAGYFAISQVA